MGDSNATKRDLHDLARSIGRPLADLDARTHSLALCFDVLVAVLGVEDKVKEELERRKAEIKAKQGNKPLVTVP